VRRQDIEIGGEDAYPVSPGLELEWTDWMDCTLTCKRESGGRDRDDDGILPLTRCVKVTSLNSTRPSSRRSASKNGESVLSAYTSLRTTAHPVNVAAPRAAACGPKQAHGASSSLSRRGARHVAFYPICSSLTCSSRIFFLLCMASSLSTLYVMFCPCPSRSKLVELKNGETFNGHMVGCDTFMNLTLRQVYQTAASGQKFWKMDEAYIRGNVIKYIRVAEQVRQPPLASDSSFYSCLARI
jgi:small nuclear ribonucleoprotein (snRNP)-like protein